jgi:hypothetical protein
LLATSPPTFGGNKSLAVEGVQSAGSDVVVAVSNTSTEAGMAVVSVAARVDGNLVIKTASVSISANTMATVHISYPSIVEGVITVGIQDGTNPF